MKKIIAGRTYDTTTAGMVGTYNNGYDIRSFHYFAETLFKKKNGEFFLYGEGGPASKYAQIVGLHNWIHGEDIIPLSNKEAMHWAVKNLSPDEYKNIFGGVGEGADEKQTLNKIKEEIEKSIKSYQKRMDVSRVDGLVVYTNFLQGIVFGLYTTLKIIDEVAKNEKQSSEIDS